MSFSPINTTVLGGALTAAILTLASCGAPPEPRNSPTPTAPQRQEVAAATPRVAVTTEQGVTILDGTTLTPAGQIPSAGATFTRLNSAGDGRHLFWTAGEEFRLIDMGVSSRVHGDHKHHYAGDPRLTTVTFPAQEPGHAVSHDGWIALWADGTGTVTSFPVSELESAEALPPQTSHWTAPAAHHGIAVVREDDSMVVSVGDESTRTGVAVLNADRHQIASSDECPNLHGEAALASGVLSFGCTDGVLFVDGEDFTKVTSPDNYGRVGNQSGSEKSSIVLGDYKSDKAAAESETLERPTKFTLTDSRTGKMRVVDLGASYSFRSLGRGPEGEAVILATDGSLHVFDAETGDRKNSWPVIDKWSEPEDWQTPRPTLNILDGTAYVTDPGQRTIRAIDLETGQELAAATIDAPPNEVQSVTG